MSKPTVLVAEDEGALVTLLRYNLEREGYRVLEARDGEEALLVAAEEQPDLVVLDWMLPQLSGIEVCRRLRGRQETRNVPIIMLTARGEESDRLRGLDTGADDYLTKPFSMTELLARLRAVLRRVQTDEPPDLSRTERRIGALTIAPTRRECFVGERQVHLTASEFNFIDQLSRRPGEVVSKDELSERVLRRAREPYDRSVDTHISNLRQKLAAAGGDCEIETVRAIGYRLKTPE